MINGLYYFEDNLPSAKIAQEFSNNVFVFAYEQIMV